MTIKNSVNSDSITEPPLKRRPIVLLLMDGWGIAPASEANALAVAKIPNFSSLIKEYPVALLKPRAVSWNSRYLTIGSGREIVTEDIKPTVTLSKILSEANLKQLKIAETERFAALSYFFNGQVEQKYLKEEWKIISSAGSQQEIEPELVLKKIVKEIIEALENDKNFDFIVAAIPFLDLVAKKGNFLTVKKAVETLDKNLPSILGAVNAQNGILIISAAGGKAERTYGPSADLINNYKINNPVPVVIIGAEFKGKTIGLADPLNNDLNLLAPVGTLADLAPTILQIMDLNQPQEMTGHSLLDKR